MKSPSTFRFAIVTATLGVVTHGARGTEPERPNIVMVMCDDLGWADVDFNGNRTIKTPHLDRWAARGLVFDRFYAAAPVCSPTRGSCLTGRHPDRYGIYGANRGHLREQERTLAEMLREVGYASGHFGKWHLGTLSTELVESNRGGPRGRQHFSPPWTHGFGVCFSTEAKVPTWNPMRRPLQASNQWWDPVTEEDSVDYGTHYWNERAEIVRENLSGDDSRVIMDRALPFMRESVSERTPFCAVIWFHAPHLPVVAGDEYRQPYAQYTDYEQHYFGCINALDEQMGRLLRELSRLNVFDNTLVFFCSDNGPEGRSDSAPGSAHPLRGRKRDLFEGGIRVPAFVVWPRQVAAGQRTEVPAVTSDYLPTILDALSREPVEDRPIDGISLMPLIRGEVTTRAKAIGFRAANQAAWIEDQYKLLKRGRETFLFDLTSDPGESQNLADRHADTVNRMTCELDAWIKSCKQSDRGDDYETGGP